MSALPSKQATPPNGAFFWPVRVYYEDTDAGGVVYHAAYLRFFERARTEWLRQLGFDQSAVRQHHGVVFAVRQMNIGFVRPARFDDELAVSVFDLRPRRASFELQQVVLRGSELLCEAGVKVACVSAADFRPKPIPEEIRRVIEG